MFENDDEQYERYVDDYEYADYDEQDMRGPFRTPKRSSSSWNWSSGSSSYSGTSYSSAGLDTKQTPEKASSVIFVYLATLLNVILAPLGIIFSNDWGYWVALIGGDIFLFALDVCLDKNYFAVEDDVFLSHYSNELSKSRTKMWVVLFNALFFFGIGFFDCYWLWLLALCYLCGICLYSTNCDYYKKKISDFKSMQELQAKIDKEQAEIRAAAEKEIIRRKEEQRLKVKNKNNYIRQNPQEVELAKWLVEMREKAGLTQEELARRTGLSEEQIRDVENGDELISKDVFSKYVESCR